MDKIEIGGDCVAITHNSRLYVNNAKVDKLNMADKAKFTKAIIEAGITDIEYRQNFKGFSNIYDIAKKVRNGCDVTLELAFQGIHVPNYEEAVKAYAAAINPVLEELAKLIPPYPFVEVPEGAKRSFEIKGSRVTRNGYSMELKTAKNMWETYSPWWAGIAKHKPSPVYVRAGGGNSASFDKEQIHIGCQRFYRWELESLALEKGWKIPVATLED